MMRLQHYEQGAVASDSRGCLGLRLTVEADAKHAVVHARLDGRSGLALIGLRPAAGTHGELGFC